MVMFFAIIANMDKEVHMPIIGGTIEDFTVTDTKGVPHHMKGLHIGDIKPVEGDSKKCEGRAFVAETVRRKDGRTITVGRIATISYDRTTGEGSLARTPAYIGLPEPNMSQSRKRA